MGGTPRSTSTLMECVGQVFGARESAGLAVVDQAATIAAACRAMAGRFLQGGKLIAFGNGSSSTDAEHLAVEFVHPVIVGKRALPALCLTNDIATLTSIAEAEGWDEVFASQIRQLASPRDIAVGISHDARGRNVARGLEAAREMGLLTIALASGAGEGAADYVLRVASQDPQVVKEVQVTMYHILWELVHVFFEQPGAAA